MHLTLLAALALPLSAQSPCSEWSPGFEVPGVDGEVTASAVFDDGTGPALYVAGEFEAVGPIRASQIARWDGTSWSPLGGGLAAAIGTLAGRTPPAVPTRLPLSGRVALVSAILLNWAYSIATGV